MATKDCITMNISELASGEYTVLSYEYKKTWYGKSYILECTCDDKTFTVWANAYVANYIEDSSPTKKFKINISDGRVNILGYSRVVVLK